VPVPRVLKVSEVGREGQWLLPNVFDSHNVFDPGGGLVDVPPEVYLRQFRDTRIDDLDALTELCMLGMIRAFGPQPYPDLPPTTNEQWEFMVGRFGVEIGLEWRGGEGEREEVWGRHPSDGIFPVHAVEVALRVRLMQRATDHFLAYLDGGPLTQAWPDCADEFDAWRKFATVIGAALQGFHVGVGVEPVGAPEEWGYRLGEPHTNLYSAGMLQLVNDLAAGETAQTCANEMCRRRFVRQLGRSVYGGHRKTGTMYCSSSCARAQYQRMKRRRERGRGRRASEQVPE
jgi:hypothetical protein